MVSWETGGVDLVSDGERLKPLISDLDHGNVSSHKLTVLFTTRYSEVRVSDDLLQRQDHVVLLLVGGGVPLSTENLDILPRHLLGLGTGATFFSLSAGVWPDVGAAAVRYDFSFLRLADEGAVSAGHQDGGAGGSGQEGDGTVVSCWVDPLQATEPRVSVTGVVQGRNLCNSYSVYFSNSLYRCQSIMVRLSPSQ